jgi:hypothetical protein
MSLSRYKNTTEVLNATKPISAKFFTNAQIKLLSPTVVYPKLDFEKFIANGSAYSKQKVEFHVYSLDGAYITGTQFSSNYQPIDDEDIFFDLQQDLAELGLLSGNYKFVYNTILDRVGSFSTEKLFVYDISNTRTEIILKLENPDSQDSIKELEEFFKYWISQTRYFINSFLNFGQNNLIPIANVASDRTQNTIYIKLFEPLPANISVQSSCWISELLSSPYVDSVQIIPALTERPTTTLQPPQFDIEKLYWRHFETDYKNWTDLTSTDINLNELVTTNLFRRKFGVKLNIDFSDLSNFIFYSSVEERILNFIYKVELISWYQEQVDTLTNLNATYSTDVITYANSKRTILNSFDDFEVFLYYGNSNLTAEGNLYKIPSAPKTIVDGTLANIKWINWAQTWANALVIWKEVSSETDGFAIIDINSQEWQDWKTSVVSEAKEFDFQNEAELIKTIPDFIRDDENNSQYLLFVNMIAHYFDTIWLYVKHFNDKYSKLEHPDLGISKDLIAGIVKNLGWSVNDSQKIKDLWFYLFGLTEENKLTRTNLPNNEYALSGKDYTKAVWKRVLLNLPRITKSKGTYRSISALLSAYGIPSSKFFVREFGGPSNTDPRPKYKQEKSISYLKIEKNQGLEFPYLEYTSSNNSLVYPNSIYFRFIPDIQTFQTGSTLIFSKDDKIKIFFEQTGPEEYVGNINLHLTSSAGLITGSIKNIEYIEELPSAIFLQTSNMVSSSIQEDNINLYFLQKKYEKVKLFESISLNLSGSYTQDFISTGSITLFNTPSSSYYLHEFRYWGLPIEKEIMESHILSPLSYHGEGIYDGTTNLLARYSTWLYNTYVTASNTASITPYNVINNNDTPEYRGNTNFELNSTQSFVYLDEFVKHEIPTIAGNGILPEKERIESSTLTSNLSYDMRSELSAYDFKENDSNKIKIGYSPQFNINEDIYNRLGTFELDEYIGSTIDFNKKYYTSLFDLAEFYYKNSRTTDDIHGYLKSLKIFDFSIFEQIRQVVPAKANAIMGIIIENNELQRIKLKQLPILSAELQESEKIEILRKSTKTATLSSFNGAITKLNDIEIEFENEPIGQIKNEPVISNKFTVLNAGLVINQNISSVLSSKNEFNSTVKITGLFGNQSETKSNRITTFNNIINFSYISSSYSSPIIGGQYGYQMLNEFELPPLSTNVAIAPARGYYANITYDYGSDVSASNQNFSNSQLKFGDNGNFSKRISKGAENHRYAGCKIILEDINTLTLTATAQNAAFAVVNIPSGSSSVVLNSEFASTNNDTVDPNAPPPSA